jgi:hypothetical protein
VKEGDGMYTKEKKGKAGSEEGKRQKKRLQTQERMKDGAVEESCTEREEGRLKKWKWIN